MKTRNIITVFLLTSLFLTVGCDNSTAVEAEQPNPLRGTKWKLVGIVDVKTGDLRVLQATNHERTFTLAFDNPRVLNGAYVDMDFFEGVKFDCTQDGLGSLSTISSANVYAACYEINYERRTFRTIRFGGTRRGYGDDGFLYPNALVDMRDGTRFCLQDNQLRLYYNDNKNYLLFKQIEQ